MSNNHVIVYDGKSTNTTNVAMLYEFPFCAEVLEDSYGARLICVKNQEEFKLFLYVEYFSENSEYRDPWCLLRNGNLTITINKAENIILEPFEEVLSDNRSGYVREVVSYELSKELLRKICDADSVSLNISGEKKEFVVNCMDLCDEYPTTALGMEYYHKSGELIGRIQAFDKVQKEKISFITYARRFYNAVFDEQAYSDALEMKFPVKKSSCLITLLMTLGTISAFFAAIGVIINAFLV